MIELKLLLENVKGYGEKYDIYVTNNVYNYVLFVPIPINDRAKRFMGTHLGIENFFKKYPSLKPKQKEIVEKIRELLPNSMLR